MTTDSGKADAFEVLSTRTDKTWKTVKERPMPEEIGKALSQKEWEEYLVDLLGVQHLLVLVGSGASLGEKVNGPSMATLFKAAATLEGFEDVCKLVRYEKKDENIENLLSNCHASLSFLDKDSRLKVEKYIPSAESLIAKACNDFVVKADLSGHGNFLRRMARRPAVKPRLQLFTTNYDLCFERAANNVECPVIDGFSYTLPRRFNPRFFAYDFVRRATERQESSDYVEGVFHLYKLHGSVDWERRSEGIERHEGTSSPCLIYPAFTKYEHSYYQPYLEMMSRFLTALRESNTTLVVIGFGFSDEHLVQPIMAMVGASSSLRLMVVDRSAKKKASEATNEYLRTLSALIAENDDRITLVNGTFEQFATLLPDLTRPTDEERLARIVRSVVKA